MGEEAELKIWGVLLHSLPSANWALAEGQRASLVAQVVEKKILLQCRRPGFEPWVSKIPWRRKWQSTPVFLPGKFHEQRSVAGYRPWGCRELDMTEQLTLEGQKESRWEDHPNHGELSKVLCLNSQVPKAGSLWFLTTTNVFPLWRALISCRGKFSLGQRRGPRCSDLIQLPEKPCGVESWARLVYPRGSGNPSSEMLEFFPGWAARELLSTSAQQSFPLSSPALSTSATTSHIPLLWESQAPLSQLLHFYLCHPCKSPGPKLDLPKLGLLPFARPDGSFQVQSQAPRPKLSAQSPSRCSLVAKQHLWSSVFSCHMTIVAKETSPLASRDTARLRQRCVTWGLIKTFLSLAPDGLWVPKLL